MMRIGITDLVRDCSILNQVAFQGERVLITRHNRAQAVLLDYDLYEDLHRYELEKAAEKLRAAMARATHYMTSKEVLKKTAEEMGAESALKDRSQS